MKISDFKSEDEMKKMTVGDIKKHVREFNEHYKISGYSKLKKDQLISQVLTAQMRVRNAGKAAPKPPAPKPPAPKKKSAPPKKKSAPPKAPDSAKLGKENNFQGLGMTREEALKLSPLSLFSKLPALPKAKIADKLGIVSSTKLQRVPDEYEKLTKLKGFKPTEFKKEFQQQQKSLTGGTRYNIKNTADFLRELVEHPDRFINKTLTPPVVLRMASSLVDKYKDLLKDAQAKKTDLDAVKQGTPRTYSINQLISQNNPEDQTAYEVLREYENYVADRYYYGRDVLSGRSVEFSGSGWTGELKMERAMEKGDKDGIKLLKKDWKNVSKGEKFKSYKEATDFLRDKLGGLEA